MKEIHNITNIFFLGIGGIGMSALARYFHTRGVVVAGYDKTPSPLTRSLQSEGIRITHFDNPAELTGTPELVVRTPAVPVTSKLYQHFAARNIPAKKRAEVLGILSESIPTIAIAGTHGKTTISAILAHVFKSSGMPCIALLGGISTNYNTNYLGDHEPSWMVAEADEFDRSFLHLSPAMALISSIDPDHLDVYGSASHLEESFSLFARRMASGGKLIAKKGIAGRINYSGPVYTYDLTGPADYYMEGITVFEGQHKASIRGMLNIDDVVLGHPGRHNLENAIAATALAHQAGIETDAIRYALASFTGVRRRFEIRIQTKDTAYVDDYAHHPEEIRSCIASARELWPGKKITGIFQPHLYSRTRDLAGEFAGSLSELDELILLDIYPAREDPIAGVDASMILDDVALANKTMCLREDVLEVLENKEVEILITMGAGDIDRLADPIVNLLKNKGLR